MFVLMADTYKAFAKMDESVNPVCRDSDISSYVGGLQPRLRDYDTGVESGDDLEEEDFSV